jgi:hypothetical protein
MTMLEKIRRWCQESPNAPISTKLRRNAAPIIAVFTATILLVSFFSYVSYVVTHPVIQSIPQPEVPNQPAPNTSTSTASNATQKQPIAPTYQQPLPPDYPLTTPSEPQWNRVLVANFTANGKSVAIYLAYQGENPPTFPAIINITGLSNGTG